MEDAGCQNGLIPFKVKNADNHVTMMRRNPTCYKFTCAHVAILDPGYSLFGLGLSLTTGQQLNNSSKNEDMRCVRAPGPPWLHFSDSLAEAYSYYFLHYHILKCILKVTKWR